MDSMLLIEDLSDDDIYSNSTDSSFWGIEACGESPYSCTWSMDTSRDSLFTSIWSSDSICSDSSYRSIWSSKTYIIVTRDRFAPPLTDTFSDSSSSSIWSITSIEDFDTQRDFVVSKEEEIDGTNNICVSLIKLSHHIIQIHNKNERMFF